MDAKDGPKIRSIHRLSLVLGAALFLYSVMSAIALHNDRFYSSFAFGSFLLLSSIDYEQSGDSVIKFFLFEAERRATLIFIAVSTLSFFAMDYYFGVRLSKMWVWIGYGFTDYVFMFAFMNVAFILSMYELYRIILRIVSRNVPDINLSNFKINTRERRMIPIIGLAFVFLPFYIFIFRSDNFIEYAMLFPFIGFLLLADYVSLVLKGDSVLEKIFSLNILYVVSFILTSLVASTVTEGVNLFGHEWEYLKMPFSDYRFLTVPVAVFIGWVPLVLAVISIVNLTKNISSKAKRYNGKKMKLQVGVDNSE